MTVEHSRPSVGVAATLVARAVGVDEQVSVQNPTAQIVYLGGTGVTASAYGFALSPAETFTVDLPRGAVLYGVVATTTSTVNVLHVGPGA